MTQWQRALGVRWPAAAKKVTHDLVQSQLSGAGFASLDEVPCLQVPLVGQQEDLLFVEKCDVVSELQRHVRILKDASPRIWHMDVCGRSVGRSSKTGCFIPLTWQRRLVIRHQKLMTFASCQSHSALIPLKVCNLQSLRLHSVCPTACVAGGPKLLATKCGGRWAFAAGSCKAYFAEDAAPAEFPLCETCRLLD